MILEDLLGEIKTYTKIKISNYDGEEFYPSYADIEGFKKYNVCSINAIDKGELLIDINPNY